jgi:putative tryptophan/tyrosine transport system substrate-binding protein
MLLRAAGASIAFGVAGCQQYGNRGGHRICVLDMKAQPEAASFENKIKALVSLNNSEVPLEFLRSWFAPHNRHLSIVASDIARESPTLVIAVSAAAAVACRTAMPLVPIIFSTQDDPRAFGLVRMLSNPTLNATGVWNSLDVHCKRVEFLLQLTPKAKRLGVIVDARPESSSQLRASLAKCRGPELSFEFFPIETLRDIQSTIHKLHSGIEALLVPHTDATGRWPDDIVSAIGSRSLPAVFDGYSLVDRGGLASLEPVELDEAEVLGRLAAQVLGGASISQLAVEQPHTTYSAINVSTAHSIGLSIPFSLVKSVDYVVRR